MIHPPRPVLLQPTPLPRWPVMTKKGKPRTPEVATRPRATPSRTPQQAPPPGGTDGEPQPRRPARTARSETWRGSRGWVYAEFQKYTRDQVAGPVFEAQLGAVRPKAECY